MYSCQFCGKSFKTFINFIFHIQTHEGERPYVCDMCSKQFKQESALKNHLRIHTGGRPYSCEICSKRFKQDSVAVGWSLIASGQKLLLPEKHSRYTYIKVLSPSSPVAVGLVPSQRSDLRTIQEKYPKRITTIQNDLMSKNSCNVLTPSYSTCFLSLSAVTCWLEHRVIQSTVTSQYLQYHDK